MEGGATQFNIKPAITTFSDHIVISYPTKDLRKLGGDDYLGMALLLPQKLIGVLAANVMRLGLLIRGGATVGNLYQAGGVVIGKAMIEAYELESRVAIYPRIAVARKLYSQVKTNPRDVVLLKDHDGITHFNYFRSMIRGGGGSLGTNFKQQMSAWLAEARRTIAQNIGYFRTTRAVERISKMGLV